MNNAGLSSPGQIESYIKPLFHTSASLSHPGTTSSERQQVTTMYRLLLVVSLAVIASQAVASSPGRCGSGPRAHNCIEGMAECQSGKCVCLAPNIWGDGTFSCYRKNTVAAEVKMDPMLTTFNNESRPFPFPCRYLVTHVKQQLKDRNRDVIGKCEFKIHAFNAKGRGKFFNHGFDVATKIMYDDGRVIKMSSRHYGIANNGVYRFWNKGTNNAWLPDGPWGDDSIGYEDSYNDIELKVKQDPSNNHLLYEFKKCGLRISFVPYDVKRRRNQVSMPGLSVGINCAMHPVWLNVNEVMALAPHWQGGSFFSQNLQPGLNAEKSMVFRAFDNAFTQNQPYDDKGQCENTGSALSKCNDAGRKDAFDNCYWMLKEPRFIRCMDKTNTAEKILKLFEMCVAVQCSGGNCLAVKSKIREYGCDDIQGIPEIPKFLSGEMCPGYY